MRTSEARCFDLRRGEAPVRRRTVDQQLAGVPLFQGLSNKHLAALAGIVTTLDIEAGRELIREGETGHEFFVVLSGEAEVRKDGTVLAVRGPGAFVGEIALLLDTPRTASVVARTDMTIDVIERRDFKAFLADHPELYEQLLTAVAARLAEQDALTD
jgi:CRP-like cAMP-binding protein